MPLPDLLEDAAATPADRVDVELLWRRGRRRARTVAGAAGALAGVVAVAALTVPSLLGQDTEEVDLAVGGTVTQTAGPQPALPRARDALGGADPDRGPWTG